MSDLKKVSEVLDAFDVAHEEWARLSDLCDEQWNNGDDTWASTMKERDVQWVKVACLGRDVGREFAEATKDFNDYLTCATLVRPGDKFAHECDMSFVRRMVRKWKEQQGDDDGHVKKITDSH